MEVENLDQTFEVVLDLDFCNQRITFGVERLLQTEALKDFDFGEVFAQFFFLQIYEIPVSILLLKIIAVRFILLLSDCNYMYKSLKRCEHFFAICRGTKRNCDDGNFQILVN